MSDEVTLRDLLDAEVRRLDGRLNDFEATRLEQKTDDAIALRVALDAQEKVSQTLADDINGVGRRIGRSESDIVGMKEHAAGIASEKSDSRLSVGQWFAAIGAGAAVVAVLTTLVEHFL